MAYSFVGLQTVYLATYFDPIYWNTACLRVDSGLEEEASTNYGKIAKAVGNVMSHDIAMSLIDINKSQYLFEPDIDNGTILYGMKALNGVGGEIIQQIVQNRPYDSFEDFLNKVKCTKTVVLALIKSGAFDKFEDREKLMRHYIGMISEPKKRITMQNFNGLNERNLIPDELDLQKRTFVFNKALKHVLIDGMYVIKDNFYDFYEQFFDLDLLEPYGEALAIPKDTWKKKCYDKMMAPAKEWITKNKHESLEKLNGKLFEETWNKYAAGTISSWEMEALGFYYTRHELININNLKYGIKEYMFLPEEPMVDREFKRNGLYIPLFETCRIAGTVIAKDDVKSLVSILTPMSGVVHVKFNRDYYAKYNRRISEPQPDGTKKVREAGWFQRGTLIVVNGFRRGDTFVAKKYKSTESHQLYKITKIKENGDIEMTNKRWGE